MSESQRYTVIGLVDATVSEEVKASSPEAARDRASLHASVCHQCSSELDVGDVYDIQVLDADGELVIPFAADAKAAQMTAEVEGLREQLADVERIRAAEQVQARELLEWLDVCDVVHEHNMTLKDRTDDMRRRLQHVAKLLDVDSADPREDVLAAAVMRLRRRGVERLDVIGLRALTRVADGANYEVWSDGLLVEGGLSKDVAIGYAMGLSRAGTLYGGGSYDPIVKVNGFIVWPEERWGDIDE